MLSPSIAGSPSTPYNTDTWAVADECYNIKDQYTNEEFNQAHWHLSDHPDPMGDYEDLAGMCGASVAEALLGCIFPGLDGEDAPGQGFLDCAYKPPAAAASGSEGLMHPRRRAALSSGLPRLRRPRRALVTSSSTTTPKGPTRPLSRKKNFFSPCPFAP